MSGKIQALTLVTLLCASLQGMSQAALSAPDSDAVFIAHPSDAPVINQDPVLELYVTLTDRVLVGASDDGERHIVPITGGHFRGRQISGHVVSGGADWQTVRQDGIKEIFALYSIRTHDGATIVVDNRGMVSMEGGKRYARTRPVFHAPRGIYDWLNKRLFIGTITSIKSPRAVIIRVYEVE